MEKKILKNVSSNFENFDDVFSNMKTLNNELIRGIEQSAIDLNWDGKNNMAPSSGPLRQVCNEISGFIFDYYNTEVNDEFRFNKLNAENGARSAVRAINNNYNSKDKKLKAKINGIGIKAAIMELAFFTNYIAHPDDEDDNQFGEPTIGKNLALSKADIISGLHSLWVCLAFCKKLFKERNLSDGKKIGRFNAKVYNNNIAYLIDDLFSDINIQEDEQITIKNSSILNILFSTKVKYSIPPYQRHFSWTWLQARMFFNDLANLTDHMSDRNHFFGNIMFYSVEKKSQDGIKTIEIVDGQQRITTVFLFLKSVYNKAKELDQVDTLFNACEGFKSFIERKRIIENIFPDDSNEFLLLLDSKKFDFHTIPDNLVESSTYKVYEQFKELIDEYSIEELIILIKNLERFVIGLGIAENLNEISLFHSMNIKGVKLSSIDRLYLDLYNTLKDEDKKKVKNEMDYDLKIRDYDFYGEYQKSIIEPYHSTQWDIMKRASNSMDGDFLTMILDCLNLNTKTIELEDSFQALIQKVAYVDEGGKISYEDSIKVMKVIGFLRVCLSNDESAFNTNSKLNAIMKVITGNRLSPLVIKIKSTFFKDVKKIIDFSKKGINLLDNVSIVDIQNLFEIDFGNEMDKYEDKKFWDNILSELEKEDLKVIFYCHTLIPALNWMRTTKYYEWSIDQLLFDHYNHSCLAEMVPEQILLEIGSILYYSNLTTDFHDEYIKHLEKENKE